MSIVETPSPAQPIDPFTIRWIGIGLVMLGAALPIFILFGGQGRAQLLTLAAIVTQVALLALIERFPQAFLIAMRRGAQPSVSWGLIIPVFSLAIAGAGAHFVQPLIPGLVALAAAGVGLLVAVWMPRSAKIPSPIQFGLLVGAFAAGLGWGAITLANRVFDSSPGQVFQMAIQDKSFNFSGRGGPHYHLTLAPWGPVDHSVTIGVSGAAYFRAISGSPLCASLHAGAFGVAWYYVGSC